MATNSDPNRIRVNSTDDLKELLTSAINDHRSAEVALLHIMQSHHFTITMLQQMLKVRIRIGVSLENQHIKVSFSKVVYRNMAPFVGLQHRLGMDDVKIFHLYRSRIPTAIFKSIAEDMDMMLVQYGPPIKHLTEEATSRFLSPIFNRLIVMFCSAFRNLPESIIEGRIATKGRIEHYFTLLGSTSVLFIEVKNHIGNGRERLDAIAQVIAECDACHWHNAQEGCHVPIHGILCDGNEFEFFAFDGANYPYSFEYGLSPHHPQSRRRAFRLPDPTNKEATPSFLEALRTISEIIFDLLLQGYVATLRVQHERSVQQSSEANRPRMSLKKWPEALVTATSGFKLFRDAEERRQSGLIREANSLVEEAMVSLKRSLGAIPDFYKPELIMSSWDDVRVEEV